MRSLKYLAAGAVLMCSVAANASITIGSITPGTNPYSGPTPTYDFDSGAGTPTLTGGAVVSGSVSGVHAQPYGSAGGYYSVGPGDTQPGAIDLSSFGNISSLSFLWGSVDSYNVLNFLDAADNVLASFTGSDIFNPANGNQTDPNTNPVVVFLLSGSDVTNFARLQLTTNPSQNAFEIDNLAINPVPEPATWGLMLLGFAGVGFAMRRTKTKVRLAQIA